MNSAKFNVVGDAEPMCRRLYGLPSYSYDMHTRVGLAMLTRVAGGVPGAEPLEELFRKCRTRMPHRVLGEALFFEEGGFIRNELQHHLLTFLEQRVFAHKFGMSQENLVRSPGNYPPCLQLGNHRPGKGRSIAPVLRAGRIAIECKFRGASGRLTKYNKLPILLHL